MEFTCDRETSDIAKKARLLVFPCQKLLAKPLVCVSLWANSNFFKSKNKRLQWPPCGISFLQRAVNHLFSSPEARQFLYIVGAR